MLSATGQVSLVLAPPPEVKIKVPPPHYPAISFSINSASFSVTIPTCFYTESSLLSPLPVKLVVIIKTPRKDGGLLQSRWRKKKWQKKDELSVPAQRHATVSRTWWTQKVMAGVKPGRVDRGPTTWGLWVSVESEVYSRYSGKAWSGDTTLLFLFSSLDCLPSIFMNPDPHGNNRKGVD